MIRPAKCAVIILLTCLTASACSDSEKEHAALAEQNREAKALHQSLDGEAHIASVIMTKYVRSLNAPGHEGYTRAEALLTTDSGCQLYVYIDEKANLQLSVSDAVQQEHARYKYDNFVQTKWKQYCDRHGFPGTPITFGKVLDEGVCCYDVFWDARP